MRRQPISERDLELQLLRRSVDALNAERLTCHRCHRTPLVGEVVYRYRKERTICSLCRPMQRGEPIASVPVRHGPEIVARRLRPAANRDAA